MLEIQNVFEINDKEFISLSVNGNNEEENRAISFYEIKNDEFDIVNIIDNLQISGFHSNTIKINEKYLFDWRVKKNLFY